ncbi:MAG: YbbR-like domain-containing protein [Faecousia sp.]
MKSKIGYIALSVLIAFGLWLYVITSVSPGSEDTYDDVPVILSGETVLQERGLMITSVSSDTVTLKLSGNRSDLAQVNRGNITVKADLSKIYEPGSQLQVSYSISFPGNLPSNAFVIESKNPGYLYVNVERRVTKEVPVEIQWIGSAPEGYLSDRENSTLDYTSVSVTGPESVTDRIEKAVIQADLTDQRESISQSFRYTLCDGEGNPVDAELITTNVEEVRLDVRIQKVKDITLVYNIVEGGGATRDNVSVTMSAETIRVCGSEVAIDAMEDQLVVGTINLAELTKSGTMTFQVLLPEGITNLSAITEVEATVLLSGLTTRDYVLENIQSINIPEGMEAELITEKLTVTVRGPAELMSKLTAENITATVDFTGAEAGTTTFRTVITFSEGFAGVGVLRSDPVSAAITPAK